MFKVVLVGSRYGTVHSLFISKSERGSSERSRRYDTNLTRVNFKFGSLLQKSYITLRQLLDLSVFVFSSEN